MPMPAFNPHQLSMTVLMSPEMANFSGKVHGGGPLVKVTLERGTLRIRARSQS